jgi:predicted acetyltransferase
MDVALSRASPEQEPVFAQLMQLYYYDLSELLGIEIGDDGLFPFAHHRSYWSDPLHHPFLIRVDGRLAGFSVVDARSRLTDEPLWDMSQFFVLRRHRAAGVGARAAMATFDMFRGRWEVREVARNTPAQAFWRKVIDQYTGGRFTEVIWDDDRWRGPVQCFDNAR